MVDGAIKFEDGEPAVAAVILISRSHVAYVMHDVGRKLVGFHCVQFPHSMGDDRWANRLKGALAELEPLAVPCTFIVHGADEMLFPEGLYDAEQAQVVYQRMFGANTAPLPLAASTSVHGLTSTISLPTEVAEVLTTYSESAEIVGSHGLLVAHALRQPSASVLHMLISEGATDLCLVHNGKLLLINRFPISGNDDLLYFALVSARSANVSPADLEVLVSSFGGDIQEPIRLMSVFFKRVSADKRVEIRPFPFPFQQIETHVHLPLFEHLCA